MERGNRQRLMRLGFWSSAAVATLVAVGLGLGPEVGPGIDMPRDFGYVAVGAAFVIGAVFRADGIVLIAVTALLFGITTVAAAGSSPDHGDTAVGSLIFIFVVGLPLALAFTAMIGAAAGELAAKARRVRSP